MMELKTKFKRSFETEYEEWITLVISNKSVESWGYDLWSLIVNSAIKSVLCCSISSWIWLGNSSVAIAWRYLEEIRILFAFV